MRLLYALLLPMLLQFSAAAQTIQLTPASPTVPWLIGAEHAGDDRLFLVRQDGFLQILTPAGTVLQTPFLDWSTKIKLAGEQGLLGLAFHPNYASNGWFYIYYSQAGTGNSVLSRLSRSATDPNVADPNSEQVLLSFPHPVVNHVGGSLKFGPDGYLYLSSGDGGEFGDPNHNAQNNQLYLGKILRFDVDGGTPYAVPTSNPFVGNPAYLPEIWCTGLRNPWRMSFDRLTGDLWIGDVGQSLREEVNVAPAGVGGQNFGWSCQEGTLGFNICPDTLCCFTPPLFEYAHNANPSCSGSITGGVVYRGYQWAALWGKYVFNDLCTGEVWALDPASTPPDVVSLGVFNTFDYVNVAESRSGELYLAGYFSNKLYHLEPLDCRPVAQILTSGTLGGCESDTVPVLLSAYGAGESGMSFQWQQNGVDLPGQTGGTLSLTDLDATSVFTVLVGNPATGCANGSNEVTVTIQPTTQTTVTEVVPVGQVFQGVQVLGDTTFTRIFSAASGCDSVVVYQVQAVSGTDEAANRLRCWLSPNPTRADAVLHFGLENAVRDADLRVLNATGQVVETARFDVLIAGAQTFTLRTADWAPGLYAVQLRAGGQSGYARLLVVR